MYIGLQVVVFSSSCLMQTEEQEKENGVWSLRPSAPKRGEGPEGRAQSASPLGDSDNDVSQYMLK